MSGGGLVAAGPCPLNLQRGWTEWTRLDLDLRARKGERPRERGEGVEGCHWRWTAGGCAAAVRC